MPSGSHPASPSKRRSRSPAPRFEPEPEPEVVEEAPAELAEACRAAPAEAIKRWQSRSTRRQGEKRLQEGRPGAVAASLLQTCGRRSTAQAPPGRPSARLRKNRHRSSSTTARTSRLGLDPRSKLLKLRLCYQCRPFQDDRERPVKRSRSARPSSRDPGPRSNRNSDPSRRRGRSCREASKDEAHMKVSAFAVVGSPKLHVPEGGAGCTRVAQVLADGAGRRRRVRPRPRLFAGEGPGGRRKARYRQRPPPQPKKKVEAPAPARLQVRTTTSPRPAAQASVVWTNFGAAGGALRGRRRRSSPRGRRRPTSSRTRGRSPRRPTGEGGGGRRRRSGASRRKRAFLAEGRRRRCEIAHDRR